MGPKKGRGKQGGLSAPVAAEALPCCVLPLQGRGKNFQAEVGALLMCRDISHCESKKGLSARFIIIKLPWLLPQPQWTKNACGAKLTGNLFFL
jgi:hypothetical protein